MPLVKTVIQAGIMADLTPIIQTKSQKAFKDAMTKFKEVAAQGGTNDVFANAAAQSSVVFGNVMKELAKEIADSVSTHVDTYTKAITVIVPPGQVVATAGTPAAQTGATTAPSPPAIIT